MDQTITFEFDYHPDEMLVEKEAKIFEAGEYPDKGITVTEDDLDGIVANFEEVPVKVEHTDSPLDPLGAVKRIWRRGQELFATLTFPGDLAPFLKRRGVKCLSVGLLKDPLRLAEVSLVLSPRVASAAMFGEQAGASPSTGSTGSPRASSGQSRQPSGTSSPPCEGGVVRLRRTEEVVDNLQSEIQNPQCGEEVRSDVSDGKNPNDGTSTDPDTRDAQIAELKFALRARDVECRLGALKAQGKIAPASEPLAKEILLQGSQVVKFSDGEATVAELFERFLEAQPQVIMFSELATGGRAAPRSLSADDEELLTKLGVTHEQVAKYSD